MNTQHFTTAAERAIDNFGHTAHQVIGLWRDGGDRLGEAAKARWDAAFAESAPKLAPETRRNAAHARKVIGGYYTRGVHLSAAGADVAVATVVQAAHAAVERAAAWQQPRA
jgi:hypothetical protein